MKIKNISDTQFEKIFLSSLIFLPVLIISWNLDNDFWFLISHGREVVTLGIPHIEPLTIHENFDFVMQQWLFSTIVWDLYSKYGEIAIIIFFTVLTVSLGVLLLKFSYICSNKKIKTSSLVSLVSFLSICCFFIVTRPQVFTYIFIVVELLSLELYAKTEKFLYLCVLPVISVLQINIHASMWGLLLVFALPYLVNSFTFSLWNLKSEGYKKIPLFVVLIAMFVCGFINPYGIKAMAYIFSSYGQELLDNTINEMAVISIKEMQGLLFFVILFMVVLVFKREKKPGIELRYELLLYGTTILTLMSQKSLAFFLIGCIPFFSAVFGILEEQIVILNSNKKRTRILKSILPLYVVLIIACGLSIKINQYSYEDSLPQSYKAIDFLSERVSDKKKAKIYTSYESGGYAEYKGFKVYMDARAEVFLKDNNHQEDVFEEYIKMQLGDIHYNDVLNKYNFSYLIIDREDILHVYLNDDENYELIYKDDNSKIYKPKV